MLTSIAYAAGGSPGGAGGGGDLLSMFLPLILMFAVFYFLLIRPQQKKAKQHKEMLSKLQKGDYVLSNGGVLGRIVNVEGDILTVNIAEKTDIKIPRGYIQGTYDPKQLEAMSQTANSSVSLDK